MELACQKYLTFYADCAFADQLNVKAIKHQNPEQNIILEFWLPPYDGMVSDQK